MRWTSRGAKRLTAIAICLFLLAGALRLASLRAPDTMAGMRLAIAVPMIYVGLLIAWIISLDWRILERDIRRLLIASAGLMIFYMLIRTAKYQFFSAHERALRHLWYAYYIPMVAIPLLQFLAALRIGRHEAQPMDARWRLLFIPALLLTAGILTNDLHGWAFRFQPGFADWERTYARGALYTAVFLWNALLLLWALALVVRKCRIARSRRGVWLPFAALLVGGAYMVWGLTAHYAAAAKIYQMPEMFCFMIVAFWELSIQVGLIPSNIGHADFFGLSTVAAQIEGAHGRVVHRSQNAPALTRAQMAAARAAPVLIAPDLRLHCHPLGAGRVYWTDDLTAVHALSAQLAQIGEALTEENELIQAENRLKRRQAQLAEQNRLYDAIARMAGPQLAQIEDILAGLTPAADDFARRVGHACVLNAYIKRRSNLMLLAEQEPVLQASELSHCIRESMDCLRAYGALCSFEDDARGKLSSARVALAYDFFEAALEAALPGLSALMVHLSAQDGGLTLRLSMEEASARLPCHWQGGALAALCGRLWQEESDGTAFVTLRFERAGEAA